MKRTVWTFGLIAGAVLSLMMLATVPFMDRIGNEHGLIIGYSTMVLAFLMVYFGIRSYRDTVCGGSISFGRAFAVGLGITLIASTCYVATWEVLYHTVMSDFTQKYAAHELARAKASGATNEQLAATARKLDEFTANYQNPLYNVAMTFLEPLPVGLLFALVSAGILRRRRGTRSSSAALSAERP